MLAFEDLGSSFENAEGSTGLGSDTFSLKEENGVYTLDWKVLDSEEASETAEYAQYFEQMNGYVKLVITLPEAAINSNATEVSEDGKTLTWNLLTMADSTAHVEFKLPSKGGASSIMPILIAVIAILVIIIIIVVVIVMKNKNKSQNIDTPVSNDNQDGNDNN